MVVLDYMIIKLAESQSNTKLLLTWSNKIQELLAGFSNITTIICNEVIRKVFKWYWRFKCGKTSVEHHELFHCIQKSPNPKKFSFVVTAYTLHNIKITCKYLYIIKIQYLITHYLYLKWFIAYRPIISILY